VSCRQSGRDRKKKYWGDDEMAELREPNEATEITSYSADRQEMKIAHMSTIAGRLNMGFIMDYQEYYGSDQDETLRKASRSMLESVMADFGGVGIEEISDKKKGFSLLYMDLGSSDSPTLIFNGEFFIVSTLAETIRIKERLSGSYKSGQSEFFENISEKLLRSRDEIKDVLSAIPNGQFVTIGDCGYYVHHLNPYVATLYSQADVDALAGASLTGGISENGLPIPQYSLNIEDFREAVTSDSRNEEIIEKLGFTERDPSVPFVPRLETGNEEFYAVGDRAFLENDLECLIQVIGNERVWYLNVSEMPGGLTVPGENKATVSVEWQRVFENQFFDNLRNLELVRRRRHRNPLDILAEMNRNKRFIWGEK
jgi:hypothetical protein